MARSHVLVTVTGADQPGITARLTGIIATSTASLLDIEQVVVAGPADARAPARPRRRRRAPKELLFAAKSLGIELDFNPVDPDDPSARARDSQRFVVTAIGRSLGARELHAVATTLADHEGNIERIPRLSKGDLGSVEIHLGLPAGADSEPLKRALLELGMQESFDVALQREGLYRRSKRLVVMDMDSTLIRIEVIDELARAHGVADRVAAITERAMQGEMDYDESLRQRLGLLEGLDVAVLRRIAAELPLTEGAETLIESLKRLGYRIAVITGGFSIAAEALKARLGIDYAYSNTLEVAGGKLTGRVVGPIVNGKRKAELLETIAQAEGVLLDQIIAVGDGANDVLMLEKAGLGIAFRAKKKLRERADTSLSAAGLDAILYLLGISAEELQDATRAIRRDDDTVMSAQTWEGWWRGRRDAFEEALRGLVEVNSFTDNREGGLEVGRRLRSLMALPGVEASPFASARYADHWVFRTAGDPRLPPIALLGHLDTVFPPGTFEGYRVDGALRRGPGVLDMKGGLVVVAFALRGLAEASPVGWSALPPLRIVVVSDEEVGSPEGAGVIRQAIAGQRAPRWSSSPGGPQDAIITRRKGTGAVTAVAHGKAAHAGNHHAEGKNAIWALARWIDAAQRLTDYDRGVTVNVGKISGGQGKNTVPDHAEAQADIRYVTRADGEALTERLRAAAKAAGADVPGTRVELSGGVGREPLERTAANVALMEAYARGGARLRARRRRGCAHRRRQRREHLGRDGHRLDRRPRSARQGLPHAWTSTSRWTTLVPKAEALARFLVVPERPWRWMRTHRFRSRWTAGWTCTCFTLETFRRCWTRTSPSAAPRGCSPWRSCTARGPARSAGASVRCSSAGRTCSTVRSRTRAGAGGELPWSPSDPSPASRDSE